jgi:uncharacterized repeat protein (TIGR04052 family)
MLIIFCRSVILSLGLVSASLPLLPSRTLAAAAQPITLRFAAKVGNQPFVCGQTYRLGQPATPQTLSDFRFYVSGVALIDANGQSVPLSLTQDGKWQYQTVALLDFENKTAACANGTPDLRDQILGTVPSGTYKGVKFSLGIPFELNHADTALAASPLNLTGLWWNWQLGYKFARIDLQRPLTPGMPQPAADGHGGHGGHGHGGSGFPIHLGSTGCQSTGTTDKPERCLNPNRATIRFNNFDFQKNIIVADLARLVGITNLSQNQTQTAPGCMSEPNDQDCDHIFTNLGLRSKKKIIPPQIFFRVE